MEVIHGDLFDTDCRIIAHQVNCQGVMKDGVAKAIKEQYEKSHYQYISYCGRRTPEECLGNIVAVHDRGKIIVHLFGQLDYGYDGVKYTDYQALREAMEDLAEYVPDGEAIAIPYHLGCGLGGGDWDTVRQIIDETIGRKHPVKAYSL